MEGCCTLTWEKSAWPTRIWVGDEDGGSLVQTRAN